MKRLKPIELLDREEAWRLIRACSPRYPTGSRNAAMFAMMYRAGLRVSEIVALEPRDLNPAEGTLNIRHGKGSKQRIVALDPAAFALVERWIEHRRRLGLNGAERLFCTFSKKHPGAPLDPRYIRFALARASKRAGIEKRLHPHSLRHVFAHELALEGTPLPVIQKLLGHSAASTTSSYLDSLGAPDALAAVRNRRWIEAEGDPDPIEELRSELAEIAARLGALRGEKRKR